MKRALTVLAALAAIAGGSALYLWRRLLREPSVEWTRGHWYH